MCSHRRRVIPDPRGRRVTGVVAFFHSRNGDEGIGVLGLLFFPNVVWLIRLIYHLPLILRPEFRLCMLDFSNWSWFKHLEARQHNKNGGFR